MSKHADINALLALFWGSAAIHSARYWFDRVASCDNPADALTKPGLDDAHLQGASNYLTVVAPCWVGEFALAGPSLILPSLGPMTS